MKVLMITSALSLRSGSPRQRQTAALRDALSRHATVCQITIDCWHSEWRDRARMRRGDRLLASRLSKGDIRPYMSLQQEGVNRPVMVQEVAGPMDAARFQDGWWNARRQEWLLDWTNAKAPDLIIVTDSALTDHADSLKRLGRPVVTFDEGLADWSREIATQFGNSECNRWFTLLADRISRMVPSDAIRIGDQARSVLALPLPVTPNDLFFAKAHSIVVPATGVYWLDQQVLRILHEQSSGFERRGLVWPEIVLIGFNDGLVRDMSAQIYSNWAHLHNILGSVRCLFLPFPTPHLSCLADAALSLGTPVLTTGRDAAVFDLNLRAGVLAPSRAGLGHALAYLMDEHHWTESAFRKLAQASRTRLDATKPDTAIADLLARSGRTPPTADRQRSPEPELPRLPPIDHDPAVIYNSATAMLMVQLRLRRSSLVQDVRLFAEDGREINRLAMDNKHILAPVNLLEGGAVCPLKELGESLRIEIHDILGVIHEVEIPVEDFVELDCEIAAAHFDDTTLHGYFWARETDPPRKWALRCADHTVTLPTRGQRRIAGLGLVAIPFRVPLPAHNPPKVNWVLQSRRSGPDGAIAEEAPKQRIYEELLSNLSQPRLDTAELAAMKDCHIGKRAWIIGNGPSVRYADLAAIPKDDVVFTFNRFYLSYDDHPLREDYVVSADTLMIQDFGQEMIDMAVGTPIFCGAAEQMEILEGVHIVVRPGRTFLPLFSLDPAQFVGVGGSSVFVALQMAWHMGIREVALYGIDYSFSLTLTRDPRYPFPVAFDDDNHFIKSYRSAKPWCPPTWRDISAGFLNARVAYEMTGGRIVNATRGGKLETFPRVAFEDLSGNSS